MYFLMWKIHFWSIGEVTQHTTDKWHLLNILCAVIVLGALLPPQLPHDKGTLSSLLQMKELKPAEVQHPAQQQIHS